MSDRVVIDGDVSLTSTIDGEGGAYFRLGQNPVIEALNVTENGTCSVPEGVDGYNPVTVDVPLPLPVIEPLDVTENGVYSVPEGVDGYSPVTVALPEYEGDYTVEPSAETQTLATAGKVMKRDVIVGKDESGIRLYSSKEVEANAKYDTFSNFQQAMLPDLPTDKDLVMIVFENNTSNSRAGIYWVQIKIPGTDYVSSAGRRVGDQFGGSYGCNVYAGATINVYVGDY